MHGLVVETSESLRITHLLKLAVASAHPFLLVGPTGTGKSILINRHLRGLPYESWMPVAVSFSAQTSANKTQEIIDSRLDRRRKGVFGPKLGVRCIVFVDDLNMPAYDK